MNGVTSWVKYRLRYHNILSICHIHIDGLYGVFIIYVRGVGKMRGVSNFSVAPKGVCKSFCQKGAGE